MTPPSTAREAGPRAGHVRSRVGHVRAPGYEAYGEGGGRQMAFAGNRVFTWQCAVESSYL